MSVSRASRPFMLMQKRHAKPDVPSRLCVGSGARQATAGNRSSNSASDLLSMPPFLRLTRRIRAMLWWPQTRHWREYKSGRPSESADAIFEIIQPLLVDHCRFLDRETSARQDLPDVRS